MLGVVGSVFKTILARRYADMLLEEFTEERLIGEIERYTHFLNGDGIGTQHHFCGKNDIAVDP